MLIDSTYFQNANIIVNTNEPDPNSKTASVLDLLIAKSERDVLSFAFGIEMWEDFKQYIVNGYDELTTPENYKRIIIGYNYTIDSENMFWNGLIQPETKESILADFVYTQYHTENTTKTTEIGEASLDTKIGVKVSSIPKITRVWNTFINKLHGGFRDNPNGYTLEGNPYWYINGGIDYYGICRKNGYVSLMQFLFDNKSDYPLLDTNYRRFGSIKNEWGL